MESIPATATALPGLDHAPLASSRGWYKEELTCTGAPVSVLCGDGCTPLNGECTDGQCYDMDGTQADCLPAVASCKTSDTKDGNGGCCPSGTLPGEPQTCVEWNCQNKLQYDCGARNTSNTSIVPTCVEQAAVPGAFGHRAAEFTRRDVQQRRG